MNNGIVMIALRTSNRDGEEVIMKKSNEIITYRGNK